MDAFDAPTWDATIQPPRTLARNGYVAYLRDPHLHTNAAASGPGSGPTPQDAMRAATYWANQLPWVCVVPWDRAPKWAREQAK